MTNQGNIIETIKTNLGLTNLSLGYESALFALFRSAGITNTEFNGAYIQYLQLVLGSTKTNITDLLAEYSQTYFDGNVNSIDNLSLPSYIFTVKTDNTGTSNDDQFTLPLISGGTYDFYVDWGDGSSIDNITAYDQAEVTHTFTGGAGTYAIKCWDILSGWAFNDGGDKEKLTTISQWGILDGMSAGGFRGCSSLTIITASDYPKFLASATGTDLNSLFFGCTSLTNIEGVENWEALNTANVSAMFFGAPINQNVSKLITSNVTSANNFIRNTNIDQDLSGMDFSSIVTATNFAAGTSMSTANYDALLISLASQSLQSGVSIDFGSATYSIGDPATAIYNLINDNSWSISSGGSKIPNLIFWIDADDSSTITESSSVISAWNDKSLEDYNISTGSATYDVTDPTKPVAQFNGTSDYFERNTPSEINNWTSARTFIMVVKVPATPVGFLWENGASASTFRDEQIYFNGSNQIEFYGEHSTGPNRTITGSQPSAGFHIFTLQIDSSANSRAVELFQDNVSLGSFASMGSSSLNPNEIMIGVDPDGGGYLVKGDYTNAGIGEFMIYDRLLTTDELSTIHSQLNTKWGIS